MKQTTSRRVIHPYLNSNLVRLVLVVGVLIIAGAVTMTLMTFTMANANGELAIAAAKEKQCVCPPGERGVCNLTDPSQVFSINSLVVESYGNISFLPNSTLSFAPDVKIQSDTSCGFSITSSLLPMCLNIPIANNLTLLGEGGGVFLDASHQSGFASYFDNITNITYIEFIGPLKLPLYLNEMGEIDATAQKGVYITSYTTTLQGIVLDSNGNGIGGNETFRDSVAFRQRVQLQRGLSVDALHPLPTPHYQVFRVEADNSAGEIFIQTLNNTPQQYNVVLEAPPQGNLILQRNSTGNTTLMGSVVHFNSSLVVLKESTRVASNISMLAYAGTGAGPLSLQFAFDTDSSDTRAWVRVPPPSSLSVCNISLGPSVCLNNPYLVGQVRLPAGSSLIFNNTNQLQFPPSSTLNLTGVNLVLNDLSVLGNFNLTGFNIFQNLQVLFNLIANTLSINTSITTPIIQVGVGGVTVPSGPLYMGSGPSTFGGPVFLTKNVTFAPTSGSSLTCTTPLFTTNSPTTPTSFPCIPDCLDFYNCQALRAKGVVSRNSLQVATDTTILDNSTSSQVRMGLDLNYVDVNNTLLTEFRVGVNGTISLRSGAGGSVEIDSLLSNNIFSYQRSSVSGIRKVSVTLTPPSCIEPLKYVNGSGSFPVPLTTNATSSTCTQIEELYEYSNTTHHTGYQLMASATVRRRCYSNGTYTGQVYCTPFFESFTRRFPWVEKFFNSPLDDPLTKSYIIGNATLSPAQYQSLVQYIGKVLLDSPPNYTFSYTDVAGVTPVDEYTLVDYALMNISSATGELSLDASQSVNVGRGSLVVDIASGNTLLGGELLDSLAQPHPCCTGSSSTLSKFKRITYTAPLLVSGSSGDTGELTLDFSSVLGSSTQVGSLSAVSYNASENSFTMSTGEGVFELKTQFVFNLTQMVNVTQVACLTLELEGGVETPLSGGMGPVQYYASPVQRTSALMQLECVVSGTYMKTSPLSKRVIKLATLNVASTSTHTDNYTIGLLTSRVSIMRIG